MGIKIWQVDAFTSEPFKGNPAGVCILDGPADEAWMQNFAMEMNLSETAFLYPKKDAYHLRWFTPAAEVALCGHATLATSHVLWSEGFLTENQAAKFDTLSGRLTSERMADGWIQMNFPATPPEEESPPDGLLEALGVEAVKVCRSRYDYLVEVADETTVRKVTPDFGLLGKVEARGVMVTAKADSPDLDFVSRFFAPTVGINEDPVTGSAHCALTPYWGRKLIKVQMNAYQASPRGGHVRVKIDGDRVFLCGQAVTVFAAELG